MSASISEAPDRQFMADHYPKAGYHSRSGSIASRSMGRVAGNAATLTKSPTTSSDPQGRERTRSTDTSVTKPFRTGTKDSIDSRTEKNNKSSSSVVPSALKNVGRKFGINGSTSGVQFNPGLINLGNSCYLNSTLQGLMSTRLLENMVQFSIPSDFAGRLFPERSPALRNGRGGEYALEYVRGMELCMTFIRTLEHGWHLRDTTNIKQRVSMHARELRNRLGVKYDQYLDIQQQDAHEFLRHLLDCMYMEEFDIIKKRQPPVPKRRRGQPAIEPPPAPVPEEERLIPFVDQVFGGQLASMLICSSCKKVSHTYEPFMDLSISIRSEEDKESKRNRLKAFAQRFTRQSGRAVPRPISNPPSPRKPTVDLEPPVNIAPRRSVEILGSRSDSDPEESKPQSKHGDTLSPPDLVSPPDSIARLGRRVSMQLGLRKSGERSRSREPKEDASTKKLKKEEAAYLRRIMADTNASKNPLELLKNGLGANGPTGDSITSAAAAWLRLGPVTGPSLLHCLRQFTAVESLEGENMVGCSRCWKLANPGYKSKGKRRDSDSSSSSSEDSSDDEEEEEPSSARSKASSSAGDPRQSNGTTVAAPDSPDSVSINTKTSETSHADSSYRGPPIPSISTPSPLDPKASLQNGKMQAGLHSVTASNATSSIYLTPVSSRHGSIRRTSSSTTGEMADDSASTASVSDASAPPQPKRQKEVRMKVPSLPKSQRVTLRRAYKRYLIAVPPPVLVIHLKRFQQVSRTPISLFASLKKIDDFIAFPEYLDLKPFIAPRREEFGFRPAKIKDTKGAYDEQVMYRLYAVVVHIGNMLGGHYIAYTALPSPVAGSPESENLPKGGPTERRWSFQSDQVVRVASLEEVLSAKAYLCFYERITEAPPTPSPDSNRKK